MSLGSDGYWIVVHRADGHKVVVDHTDEDRKPELATGFELVDRCRFRGRDDDFYDAVHERLRERRHT